MACGLASSARSHARLQESSYQAVWLAFVSSVKRRRSTSMQRNFRRRACRRSSPWCTRAATPTAVTTRAEIRAGAIFDIARELDPAIDIVLSAHTHRGYNCVVDGRVIIQAASYGRLVSVIDLEIDRTTGKIVRERTHARNVPVPNGIRTGHALRAAYPPLAPDPKVGAIVEHYLKLAAPLAQRPVGRIAADFDRRASAGGDNALGRLIADAQLAVTRAQGAQIAFTNPGGLRDGPARFRRRWRCDLLGCLFYRSRSATHSSRSP